MTGARVFITGMGGEIGTRVARVLEADSTVEAIFGVDLEPPRRWMKRADFHFVRPTDGPRVRELVEAFGPTTVIHLWAFEPHSRSTPTQAKMRTRAGTESLFAALDGVGGVDHIVVRSGIEVYGAPRRGERPDHDSLEPRPSSPWGHSQLATEQRALESAAGLGATLARCRLAPVSGSHMPSPLARYLRLPAVPIPLTGRPFPLLHLDDAAAVLAAAAVKRFDGVLDVASPDRYSCSQALRFGRRVPLPTLGPFLRLTGLVTELLGSPLPAHTLDLITRGAIAGPSRLEELGIELQHTTRDCLHDLYAWGEAIELAPDIEAA